MKRKRMSFIMSAALIAVLCLCAAIPTLTASSQTAVADSGYYSSVTAASGKELLGQLHDLIVKTHTYYSSYNDSKNKATETDPGSASGTVLEFYTHINIKVDSWDVPGGWNREHVWPKSDSNGLWETSGGGSDLHHIRPAEKVLNGSRGNKLYGEVNGGTAEYTSVSNVLGGHSSGNTFEPLDNVKGDVARILMYMYTHYNDKSVVGGTLQAKAGTYGDLPITNIVSAGSAEKAWELLLRWNKLDPVDNIERTRNEAVYGIQHNRNPFIDNENYADAIWGDGSIKKVDVESVAVTPNNFRLTVGESANINVAVSPAEANQAVTWSSSDANVAKVEGGKVIAVSDGEAVITATSVSDSTKKGTATVTVAPLAAAESITITPNVFRLKAGESADITAAVNPSNANQSVVWTSSNPNVAKVEGGKVIAVSDGEAVITAACASDRTITVAANVYVKDIADVTLSGTPNKKIYGVGETFDPTGLTVTINYTDGSKENVALDDPMCLWTDNSGNTALSESTTKIIFKFKSFSQEITGITVKYIDGLDIMGTPKKLTYVLGQTFDPSGLTAALRYSDGSSQEIPLDSCKWVDSETGSEKLGVCGSVTCKYGNLSYKIIGLTVKATQGVTIFKENVAAVGIQNTHKDKYEKIKIALDKYATLTDDEKEAVKSEYNTLKTYVDRYNAESESVNGAGTEGIKTAVAAMSRSVVALLAVWYILSKKS